MELIKANIEYKPTVLVTTCGECGSEFSYSRKDTVPQTYSIGHGDYKTVFFVQCPYCGKWRESSFKY